MDIVKINYEIKNHFTFGSEENALKLESHSLHISIKPEHFSEHGD